MVIKLVLKLMLVPEEVLLFEQCTKFHLILWEYFGHFCSRYFHSKDYANHFSLFFVLVKDLDVLKS